MGKHLPVTSTRAQANKKKSPILLPAADCDNSSSLKGIAIARVSSKEQAEGYSIDAQKKPIIEYCQRKDIEIVRMFEFWETAKKAERKHFDEAIKFLVENELKIIAIEKTDRLYRNFRDYVLIEDLIEKHGIAIHFVKEGEVFDKNSNSHAKVMHGFKVVMAKSYLDNLSEEVKKGQKAKAEQGHLPTIAPCGYTNNKQTRAIDINPETAPVVKKIFKMYDSGEYSIADITICLNDYGHGTRGGGPFHRSTVHRILTNPIYYGDFKFHGQLYKGKHEPIIDYDLWQRCQVMRPLCRQLIEHAVDVPPGSKQAQTWSGNTHLFQVTICGAGRRRLYTF